MFEVDGANIIGTTDADAYEAGIFVSCSSNICITFDIASSTLVGCGTLIELNLDGESTGLSNFVFVDSSGDAIPCACYYGSGCTDPEACNYDETATADDGSCIYPEENYDCDGNCIVEVDCAGECGGSAELDECGVCNGDGSSCSGSAHLEIQNVNLTAGTLDIYMENDVPVAGFEFYLSGMTITNLSDGTANEYLDFVEFHSPIGKILGVSISGATIPTGVGVLTTVSFIEFGEDSICFVDDDACANSTEVCEDCTCENNVPVVHIIAGSNANEIPSTWGDCFVNDDNWVYGCTYDTATNYNPEATFDDGSCEFLWGDMNHDGTLNVQDIIFLVNAILSGDWF